MSSSGKPGLLSRLLERAPRTGAPELGSLEIQVMEALWIRPGATAQEVLGAIAGRRIALSTVQSTLERLVRKRLLARAKQGRAYVYRSIMDREELIGLMIGDVASRLSHGRITPMISGFCSFVEESGSKRKSRDIADTLRSYLEKKED